ncbi:MAG: arginine--tRNA ligase [Clostridia bacterium]|nr:arginine--tRNA ligase [Clostridia bacterium]
MKVYTLDKKKAAIRNAVAAAVNKCFEGVQIPDFSVEIPREKEHGDFAVNAAMLLAKALRKPPREIAAQIASEIDVSAIGARAIDVAGAGFINFTVEPDYLRSVLDEISDMGDDYGNNDMGKGKKVMIEFVSANPTGPMHMGNARGGALGDTLANVLSKSGYLVSREFYINDAGAQIDKFGRSLNARYIEILQGEDAIDFPEDGYRGEDIRIHAQNYIDLYGDALLQVSAEQRKAALIEYALKLNIAALHETLERYKINYDVWFHESVLHQDGEVDDVIDKLKQSGLTYEKDGALWIKTSQFADEKSADRDKDDVLVRANGVPTYFAADIAYHRNKIEKRGFDKCINIWGADHYGHVARMKGALSAIGIDSSKLEVIIIQLVRLMENGEIVRMSKRTGKMITLTDLIDDIGVDAARFFFNMRAAGSHMDFDLSLAIKQSSDNPVFYAQYAHARICSIISLAQSEGLALDKNADTTLLQERQEHALLLALAQYPAEIRAAAASFDPSSLTRYVTDLAAAFHSFYNACRVRDDDQIVAKARLRLCDATRSVIKNTLTLLGVSAPEKM